MPGLGTYQKIVIGGKSFGSEIWQTGFYVEDPTIPTDQPALQTICNAIEPFVNTWWTAIKAFNPALVTYTGISMYQYVDPNTSAQFAAQTVRTAVPGTLSTGQSPIDTCCVVSIRSTLPGRSGRNRMYVPCMSAINGTTGNWDSTVPNGVGTATKALWTAISGGTAVVPVVVSRTLHEYNVPVQLITDAKPDVQRRRENRLPANYQQVLAWP